jgi:hypothetical protein
MLTSVQHFLGALDDRMFSRHALNGVHPERTVALGEARDQHVFHDGQIAEDLRRLKHPADAHLVDLERRAAEHGLTVERSPFRCRAPVCQPGH